MQKWDSQSKHRENQEKKTHQRLTRLLSRRRSIIYELVKKDKLQMKFERFDLILEQDKKLLRLKDGEGIWYIEVETSTLITLKEIQERPAYLYFDHDAFQNS